MTGAWLAYAMLVGVLLAAAAVALDAAARVAHVSTRWIWVATLAAIIGFVVVMPRRAPVPVRISAMTVGSATMAHSTSAITVMEEIAAELNTARVGIGRMESRLLGAADRAFSRKIVQAFMVGWVGTSTAIVLLIVAVAGRAQRVRATWPVADLYGARVRVSPLAGPLVLGLTRPEIVIPQWLLARPPAEQRLVLAHERAHLSAHDHLMLGLGWLALAALPWHPAVWYALGRLRLAIELDCDARVLRQGVGARNYGSLLIDIAGQCAGLPLGAIGLADTASHLERRLLAMKPIRSRFTTIRAGALCAAALLALATACEARLPTNAEIQNMDAASAQKTAMQANLIDRSAIDSSQYYVDGKLVSASDARAFAPAQISSVNVVKASAGKRASIRITTRAAVDTADDAGASGVRVSVTGSTDGIPALQSGTLRLPGTGAFTGITVIDGVRADSKALSKFDSHTIASVDVYKGIAATKMFSDSAAANGVILITTKK